MCVGEAGDQKSGSWSLGPKGGDRAWTLRSEKIGVGGYDSWSEEERGGGLDS